jgi:LysR family transcriptional activator of mexEF-oprN operon
MLVGLMSTVDHFDLRSFDLNLFLAFDAIMIERSVTRAARRLRVRQPAMSHSLSMLRMMLQDELFVRRGQIMEPTPYALRLAGPVRRVLAEAQDALMARNRLDKLPEQRVFRIAISSHFAAVPDLFVKINAAASNVRLALLEANENTIPHMLKQGHSEIVIGCFEFSHNLIHQETLFLEQYVCCFNSELLAIGHTIGSKDYFELPHVTVSTKGNSFGRLEGALAALGRTPNVALSVPDCFTAAIIAARTPVLTTLPASVATRYAAFLGLTLSPLPFEMEPYPVSMFWHSRLNDDDNVGWVLGLIKDVVK